MKIYWLCYLTRCEKREKMIMCISVVSAVFLLFLFYKMRTYQVDFKGLPQGPPGRPLLGITLEIIGQTTFHKLSDYACAFGDIFWLKVFHRKLICLSSKNAMKQAFAKSPCCKMLNDRPYSFFGDYVLSGQQSVLQYRQGHCRIHGCMRKGIMKSLHVYGQDGLNELEEMVQHEVDRLIHVIHKEKLGSKELDVVRVVQRSLSSLMSSLISGSIVPDSEEDCDTLMDYIKDTNYFLNQNIHTLLTCFPFLRNCPGLFSGKYQRMIKVRDKIIQRYFVKSKWTNSQKRGVVNILLAQQKKSIREGTEEVFTDERIKCNILELMSTGILSMSSLITSSLLCLLNDPGYQDRVFEQLDGLISKNGRLSLSERDKCPLLEALELEIYRYVTIAPLLIPRVPEEDVQFNDYIIPKDTLVIGNIWHVHHDEKVWHDPWNFRPQRFLDDNGRLLPVQHDVRERLIPFGVGRRQCIGRPLTRSVYFLYMSKLLGCLRFSGCVGKYKPCNPKHLENFDTTTIPFIQPKPFFCCVEKRHSD